MSASFSRTRRLVRLQRSPLFRALLLLALLVLLVALWQAWDHEAVLAWKREAGPVPFFIAMALLPALGFPMTPFFVIAGATFGTVGGLLGSGVALLANLMVCFWIAHSGLRPHLARLISRRTRYELPVYEARDRRTWRFALVVRVAPALPVFTKNYLLGLAGVPLGIYLGVSLLFSGLYGASFVVLGESLLTHDPVKATAAVAVLALASAGVWAWRRRLGRRPSQSAQPVEVSLPQGGPSS